MSQFGQKGGGVNIFQNCLKLKNVPKVGERGGGSTLIGTLSLIFSIFYFDASPRLELAKFWFGSVASLKFDCLIQTGQMLDGQILHGEMFLPTPGGG